MARAVSDLVSSFRGSPAIGGSQLRQVDVCVALLRVSNESAIAARISRPPTFSDGSRPLATNAPPRAG